MPTQIFIEPTTFRGLPHSAAALAVPHSERPQEMPASEHRSAQGSQLAELAASTSSGKVAYGVLAFWIVVAFLLAARIVFLEPSKIESTSSLSGTTASSSSSADTASRRN